MAVYPSNVVQDSRSTVSHNRGVIANTRNQNPR